MTVAGVDPVGYETLAGFKSAVYAEAGTGSWLADAKLEVVYREAHDEEIPDHLTPLLPEQAR